MIRHFFIALATSLSFMTGCGPAAGGGDGTTASSSGSLPAGAGGSGSGSGSRSSTVDAGGSSTAFGTADAGGRGVEGSGGVGATLPPDPEGDPGRPCDLCTSALGGNVSGALCGPSQLAFDGFLACACAGICSSVCGNGAPGNCIDAWAGNPPLSCKTCLVSTTGCGATWDACVTDDGVTPPGSGSTSAGSGGSACSCDAAAPLCPGGGQCATPGPFDGPGNEACGSAEYCAPCCDPGDACAAQGACTMTLVDQAPCSMDYECCSGVCAAGKCDGGCGIVISF